MREPCGKRLKKKREESLIACVFGDVVVSVECDRLFLVGVTTRTHLDLQAARLNAIMVLVALGIY